MASHKLRIGIDLGGTKIAGIAFDAEDRVVAEIRRPTPRDDYDGTISALAAAVAELESRGNGTGTVGVGMPGSISPVSGSVQGANSVWLNGRSLSADVAAALGREVRFANDANCFALSEAADGAATGADSVFGVILGTGCGGGIIINGRIVDGPNRTGGEWGHTPLPWARPDEHPGPLCWCGRAGCMETWVAGPGLERDHREASGERLSGPEIAARSEIDPDCRASLDRHMSRLARGLAMIVNIVDPHVIVLGGGLSQLGHLYDELPDAMRPWIFAEAPVVDIRAPVFGDASGVRGAARLWSREETY